MCYFCYYTVLRYRQPKVRKCSVTKKAPNEKPFVRFVLFMRGFSFHNFCQEILVNLSKALRMFLLYCSGREMRENFWKHTENTFAEMCDGGGQIYISVRA